MIIDCRTFDALPDRGASQACHVFVDGREIRMVWYVDTEAGIVKTLDALGDGVARMASPDEALPELVRGVCEDRGDGVLSRTLCGRVELRPL